MARHRQDPHTYLAQLQEKQRALKQKIQAEKGTLRANSRKRRAHQSRLLGESVLRLADGGLLNEVALQQIMADVNAHANENHRAALAGTLFEIAPEPKPSSPPAEFGLLAQAKRRRDPPNDR